MGEMVFAEDRAAIVDYGALGFGHELYESADWGPAIGVFDRQDGVADPFSAHNPVIKEDYVFSLNEDTEEYDEYFASEAYDVYTVDAFTHSNNHYALYMRVDDGYVLRFFDHNASTAVSYYAGYWVDVVESNGIFSYILNSAYYGEDLPVKDVFFEAFHCIYHEEGFPFAVYFNSRQIFLISKDPSFDKECIYRFRLSGEVRLFKY